MKRGRVENESSKLFVTLAGFDKQDTAVLSRKITNIGCSYEPSLSPLTTHLVCGTTNCSEYAEAQHIGLICLTREWLDASEAEGHPVCDSEEVLRRFLVPPLYGCVICTTGLTKDERDSIQRDCVTLGALFSVDLTSAVTHLIAKGHCDNPKYLSAVQNHITIVTPEWIARAKQTHSHPDELSYAVKTINSIRIQLMTSGFSVTCDVDPKAKISELKTLVQQSIGLPPCQQRLFFNGHELNDDHTIADYKIRNDNLVQLMAVLVEKPDPDKIEITLVTSLGVNLEMKLDSDDYITKIKSRVNCLLGIPAKQQRLTYDGKELEDDQTLSFYHIMNGSTLYLDMIAIFPMKIFVTTLENDTIPFDLNTTVSIMEVKTMIEKRNGIPVSEQRLFYSDQILDDDKTLADYNITNRSSLRLIRKGAYREIEIYVKTLIGQFALRVGACDTIAVIKDKICERQGLSPDEQRIIFNGRNLEDKRTLADYGIIMGSVLTLVLRLRSSEVEYM